MGRLTRDDLKKMREAKIAERHPSPSVIPAAQVVVGMSSCGVAAGAQEAFDAFAAELAANRMDHVKLQRTGCIGLCFSEPTVEVAAPGLPTVVYGRVNSEIARRIVREHLIGGQLLDDHIYDKPAADLWNAPSGERKE